VIESIGHAIISGEFGTGQALPGEAQLCSSLGVSRTALREALRVLASKGLVEPRRKLGTLVRSTEHWNFLDAEILDWLLEVGDTGRVVGELYELRHLLEPVSASLAAQHATPHDLRLLRHTYEGMVAAGDDGEAFAEPDLMFHQGIMAASGNRLFSSLAHIIEAALKVNFALVRDAPQGHAISLPNHRCVLEAIEARDSRAARVAMQKLIDDSQREARRIKRTMQRRQPALPVRKSERGL